MKNPKQTEDGKCPECGEKFKFLLSGDCECSLKNIVVLTAKDFYGTERNTK